MCNISKGEQLGKAKQKPSGKYYVLNGGIEPSGFCDSYNRESNLISISEGGNSCGYVNYNTERFWSGGHCYTLQDTRTDDKYLYQYLKSKQDKLMSLRVGSGLPNIQKTRLSEFGIRFPNIAEQKKIGSLLCNLDTLITLHQRK